MNGLNPEQFAQFFEGLHGYKPFPWQLRLAETVCASGWPQTIDVPTASGKTAIIDIALFSLAIKGPEAPRRIFFIVDRRVIVNEAYERALRISHTLIECLESQDVVGQVARALNRLAGDSRKPLRAYELRGGVYRDESWIRSPLQPTVVTSRWTKSAPAYCSEGTV